MPTGVYKKNQAKLTAWPGPFLPRTDHAHLTRKAVWLQCYNCQQLFARDMSLARKSSSRGHQVSELSFCSRSCQGHSPNKPHGKGSIKPILPRNCIVCGKEFYPKKNTSKTLHCSPHCGTVTQSQKVAEYNSRALITFLSSRGYTHKTKMCEYCGSSNKVSINRINGNRRDLRPGNLELICWYCARKRKAGDIVMKLVTKW